MTGEVAARGSKKGIWGWMLFDWAAQPFFTIITTFIFSQYIGSPLFSSDTVSAQKYWGYGIAFAGFVIAIMSPILGSVADQTGNRKRWIGAFAIIQAIACWMLWYAAPGTAILIPIAFFVLATIAAESSTVFNDSMLPRIASKADIGRISNVAWGLGYLGGMIMLIFIVLFLTADPETGRTLLGGSPLFGLDPQQGEAARASGPMSAIWYLVFIVPLFLFTPDSSSGKPLGDAVRSGLAELKETVSEVRRRSGIARFLIARMIYQDGVNALLALGGIFAAAMFNWATIESGLFGIILNVVAIFGCLLAGKLDTKLGSKKVVIASLISLTIATIGILSTGPGYTLFGLINFGDSDSGGLFGSGAEKAYIAFGLLIGIAFGPVQASSRSYLARSVSAAEAGRYFGIYALSGRATSFLAPFLYSTVIAITGSPRLGMSVILLFFAVGLYILWRTPYPAANPVD